MRGEEMLAAITEHNPSKVITIYRVNMNIDAYRYKEGAFCLKYPTDFGLWTRIEFEYRNSQLARGKRSP